MGRRIRRILGMLLAMVFVFSVTYIVVIYYQYRANARLYEEMAERFTWKTGRETGATGFQAEFGQHETEGTTDRDGRATCGDVPPISVDFDGLREINNDIVGWLYCEGTLIDYPILQGKDNNQYLHHSYDGAYNMAGSIFVEMLNERDFEDSNTIIYGHHMKDGSMFAVLDKWESQEFYESHPVMWLLTPNQDYRIDLFSGYTTSAYSETYTIFTGACDELEEYLAKRAEQSVFQADVKLDSEASYVVLSTCAYVFDNARNVLHGKMVPIGSSGG